jgi:hypothetical protein
MIIQTIGLDSSGAVWTDGPSNGSRPDPSGADQIDIGRSRARNSLGLQNCSLEVVSAGLAGLST